MITEAWPGCSFVHSFFVKPGWVIYHSGIGEAKHVKFCVLILTEEYSFMHDTLPRKGYVQSRVTSLKFGK